MHLTIRIQAFSKLGRIFRQFVNPESRLEQDHHTSILEKALSEASANNPWFTPVNMKLALTALGEVLREESLKTWLNPYFLPDYPAHVKTIGLIAAGNIPLVGFHDMLCVLITGHKCLMKLSGKDKHLPEAVGQILVDIEPQFRQYLSFTTDTLHNYDAVIATGSNNSSRYFEYYFRDYPHIIRKNRNSVAILSGNESQAELQLLADDIFQYFGLGCRNVSMLYFPEEYNIPGLIDAFQDYGDLVNYHKYANNYEYNRAVYLVNRIPHYDSGFVLLKEDKKLASPLAVLHYQYYKDVDLLREQLKAEQENIQCIVSGLKELNHVPFGQTQTPQLWDYADSMDTIRFLTTL
jgi:hypothetical protein